MIECAISRWKKEFELWTLLSSESLSSSRSLTKHWLIETRASGDDDFVRGCVTINDRRRGRRRRRRRRLRYWSACWLSIQCFYRRCRHGEEIEDRTCDAVTSQGELVVYVIADVRRIWLRGVDKDEEDFKLLAGWIEEYHSRTLKFCAKCR